MNVWNTTKLKETRAAVGLKAKDVASKVEVTPQYLSGVEHGKYQPSAKLVSKLSAIYKMPIAYFLSPDDTFALDKS